MLCTVGIDAVKNGRCSKQVGPKGFIYHRKSSRPNHSESDGIRMFSALFFLALLSSALAWGVCVTGRGSAYASLFSGLVL